MAFNFPPTKLPTGVATLLSYVLPPVVCYFIVAVLAVTPQTHTIRVALWPVIVLLAWRAVVSVDMSCGEPEDQSANVGLLLILFIFVIRTLDWALDKKPLVRYRRPANSPPSIIVDTIDLTLNFRGVGWSWSHNVPIPRETRPTNRASFVAHTFLSAIAHALVMSILHRVILTFGLGDTSQVSTIFDDTLPFQLRYLRSTVISTCAAFTIYAVAQVGYDLYTILGILIFGQDPTQWPPAFDAPWRATSVSEFWGRRWHQWCRRFFLTIGGSPFSVVFGRAGMIVGAFLASAAFHHVALQVANARLEARWMLTGFGMMAVGVLAERTFLRFTGRRVGGVAGWVWAMAWLLLWGNAIAEGFVRAGAFGNECLIDYGPSVRALVERLVIDFETWVHTI